MGSWERPLFIIVGRLEMVNKIGRPELFWGGGGGFKNEISQKKKTRSYYYS